MNQSSLVIKYAFSKWRWVTLGCVFLCLCVYSAASASVRGTGPFIMWQCSLPRLPAPSRSDRNCVILKINQNNRIKLFLTQITTSNVTKTFVSSEVMKMKWLISVHPPLQRSLSANQALPQQPLAPRLMSDLGRVEQRASPVWVRFLTLHSHLGWMTTTNWVSHLGPP